MLIITVISSILSLKASLISFQWHLWESHLCLSSKQAVMSLPDTVDEPQHGTNVQVRIQDDRKVASNSFQLFQMDSKHSK